MTGPAGLDIQIVNAEGQQEIWRVETFGSPNLFSRMGVEERYFKVGERIMLAGRVSTRRHFPYTETARAAMAEWDPVTAPVAQCETPGMPVPMYQPLSFIFTENGDTAVLQTEYFGVTRTIHLVGAEDPETIPPSPLGYSAGHWEGNTLVVETIRINYPYFNSGGAPQSEDVHVLERFTLSEDQSELTLQMTITDPLTFTEPATAERLYVALGAEFIVLDCTIL